MVGTKLKLVCDSPMKEKKKERKKKKGYVRLFDSRIHKKLSLVF